MGDLKRFRMRRFDDPDRKVVAEVEAKDGFAACGQVFASHGTPEDEGPGAFWWELFPAPVAPSQNDKER